MSIIMALISVERYHWKHKNIKCITIFALGDDVLIACKFSEKIQGDQIIPVDVRKCMGDFADMWAEVGRWCGFKLETGYSAHLARADYLSCVFWPVEPQPTPNDLPYYYWDTVGKRPIITHALGVKPGRWLARQGWIIDPSLRNSKSICLGSLISNDFLTRHVPLVQDIVEIIKKKLAHEKPMYAGKDASWTVFRNFWELKSVTVSPIADTRTSFYIRYGVELNTFDELLAQLTKVELPLFISHPSILLMVGVDLD